MSESWTVLKILEWTSGYFKSKDIDLPRLDAELLLSRVLGLERIHLYVQYDRPLTEAEREQYRTLVRRRGAGEPIAYLLGEQEFWSLMFEVKPGVLIPRPDTETLVEEALEAAKILEKSHGPALRIADVGTGSGCVAAALAHELCSAHVFAGDVAPGPLEVAPRNAMRCGVADRVHVIEADNLLGLWEAAKRQPFHMVVSNPPYIRSREFPYLMEEVRDFEPRVALEAGIDGLDVLEPLIGTASMDKVLLPGGFLAIEVSDNEQSETVKNLIKNNGFSGVRGRADLQGITRVVAGWRSTR
jgi:release factor glutamine methyltransferase